ncbi:hypothetical protein B0H14DRAFT_2645018 [Mycena olivaceomarginata]|nr:hypothetical protein B0H14DRAFT_2645018 [Mycena olivaceomarginata]
MTEKRASPRRAGGAGEVPIACASNRHKQMPPSGTLARPADYPGEIDGAGMHSPMLRSGGTNPNTSGAGLRPGSGYGGRRRRKPKAGWANNYKKLIPAICSPKTSVPQGRYRMYRTLEMAQCFAGKSARTASCGRHSHARADGGEAASGRAGDPAV